MSDERQKQNEERIRAMQGSMLPMVQEPEEPDVSEYTVESDQAPADVDPETVRERIVEVLKTVHDPEIPVNIYELGLIYGFDLSDEGEVNLRMTLTAPGCPVAGSLVREVAEKVGGVDGVKKAHVQLVWDPPWTMERMSEEARLELGLL